MMKIQTFYSVSHWWNLWLRQFVIPLEASTIFYDTAFPYGEILSKLLLKYERLWKEHVIVIFRKEPFGRNKIR